MYIAALLMLLLALLVFVVVLFWRKFVEQSRDRVRVPRKSIAVDGSNVLHWGGEPSLMVVSRVVEKLTAQGLTPIVFFDANVGYKVDDRYYAEGDLAALIGLPKHQILVVDKGVVADEWLLEFSTEHQLRIVTNDNFRDWRLRYPIAAEKGRLVKGAWRSGAVVFRNL